MAEIDSFIGRESTYPGIVTSSEFLTNDVITQTCKLIMLGRSPLPLTSAAISPYKS